MAVAGKAWALGLIVLAVIVACVRFGSFVAGGSDSYCYVHQAERWASGRLQASEPLALEAPWPEAPLAFAPAGHLPSPTVPGAIVPICPPGLSMVMAPFLIAGGPRAAFSVVPLFGVLLILATYIAGARFGDRIGLAAAALLASSPVFLYQVIQPMSDVPAAALWMLAVAAATGTRRKHVVMAGLAASAAILVRPNLVPLGFAIGLFLLFRPERSWRARLVDAASYAGCCAPGCVAILLIQQAFYGSPLASGYGSLQTLFGFDHVLPNASRYFSWALETHTPAILVTLAIPFLLPGLLGSLYLLLIALNIGLYLPYVVFEDWSYLRFFLPALALLLILTVAAVDAICRRLRLSNTKPVLMVVTIVLGVFFLGQAREHNAFRLRQLEARFEQAGVFAGRRLPPDALVITSWHSGSVRFYARRPTLVWDGLPAGWLDRAVGFVRTKGYTPYLLLERWEEPVFRERFRGSALADLDWPPMAEVGAEVRIYDIDGRERYLRGENSPTEYAR